MTVTPPANAAVSTFALQGRYQIDPLAVYQKLCSNKTNTVLLESAEIDQKHQLKSLLLVDAALKIVCHGQSVTFTPLSDNGQSALAFAKHSLEQTDGVAELTTTNNQLIVHFAQPLAELDEKSRLLATNPFQALRLFTELDGAKQHPFSVFLGGALAFDMIATSEPLPSVNESDNTCPDYVFYLAETLIAIDHESQTTELIGNAFSRCEQIKNDVQQQLTQLQKALDQNFSATQQVVDKNAQPVEVTCDFTDQEFCTMVEQLKEHVCAGDIFQVVPSRTFSLACDNPLTAYQVLKARNPSPYMFFLQDDDFCMFGASPESSLKYQVSNRQVELYPIAGTRPRGFDANGRLSPDLDSRIELDLRLDKKELSEHIMLVDLARNDIARVSQPGTRHVADLLKVDRYSHVMHLVSRVCGTLSEDLDALHAYQACMNMGTLSGAPKVRATELIRQFEGKRRGSYGGAVGYFTGTGEMDTCIVIRSAFVNNGIAQVQAGAGVVYDSNPQAEADETRQKAQAVISAIQQAASFIDNPASEEV
ncbi:anthranilate synthase component 1 [Endozoicomonas sp. G2_1]|uniref:anthranilate synthase component 1 n=1 Tax=Endozoicomonas sp. G2_1 TaxID=2821091 RepID=UPI001ADB9E84|nr:anthranilate synthase component 1 [Endozoicomonas sp. G2_1]MBO9491478.1 anthranilate synthase component 1 [Endozoicomonas sp. G2_1]